MANSRAKGADKQSAPFWRIIKININMNKAKLLGASIVGNGLRYARRPNVYVGSQDNGFVGGDFLDANAVVDTSSAIAEAKTTEIADQVEQMAGQLTDVASAVQQVQEDVAEISTPTTTIGTPKVVGQIVNGDVAEDVYEVMYMFDNPNAGYIMCIDETANDSNFNVISLNGEARITHSNPDYKLWQDVGSVRGGALQSTYFAVNILVSPSTQYDGAWIYVDNMNTPCDRLILTIRYSKPVVEGD